jgi:hypothetical protein
MGMGGKQLIRKQLTEPRLRPPVHNAMKHSMQVGARTDVVSDTRRHDGQDGRRALGVEAIVAKRGASVAAPNGENRMISKSNVSGAIKARQNCALASTKSSSSGARSKRGRIARPLSIAAQPEPCS